MWNLYLASRPSIFLKNSAAALKTPSASRKLNGSRKNLEKTENEKLVVGDGK